MPSNVLTEVPLPNHPFLQGFETSFDAAPYREWMENYWTYSIAIGAAYVIAIFSIQHHMKNKQPYNLRLPLGIWSSILAIFSVFGTIRTCYELVHTLNTYGLQFSVCNPHFYTGPTGFWVMLYAFSKVYELGDTLFIVLRKQKLIFLHWYHHLVTMIYMFFAYKDFIGLARWGITMNFAVHSVMYTYYALRAFKVRVPRWINVGITSMQLAQMTVGVTLNAWVVFLMFQRAPCQQTWANNIVSFIMYASYLVLFANFFNKAYVKEKKN